MDCCHYYEGYDDGARDAEQKFAKAHPEGAYTIPALLREWANDLDIRSELARADRARAIADDLEADSTFDVMRSRLERALERQAA